MICVPYFFYTYFYNTRGPLVLTLGQDAGWQRAVGL